MEFDPASAWYYASLTITAGWLKSGGKVRHDAISQPPDDVRSQLSRIGLNVAELEKNDDLQIWDAYTVTLGQKSSEKYNWRTLKVSEASIAMAAWAKSSVPSQFSLFVVDDISVNARFNDEKAWVEFELTRGIPITKSKKIICVNGTPRGVLSEWAHKKLEAAYDGLIDVRLEETDEETHSLMRIRAMRNVHFDSRWHGLKVGENFEVTLEK